MLNKKTVASKKNAFLFLCKTQFMMMRFIYFLFLIFSCNWAFSHIYQPIDTVDFLQCKAFLDQYKVKNIPGIWKENW